MFFLPIPKSSSTLGSPRIVYHLLQSTAVHCHISTLLISDRKGWKQLTVLLREMGSLTGWLSVGGTGLEGSADGAEGMERKKPSRRTEWPLGSVTQVSNGRKSHSVQTLGFLTHSPCSQL